VDEERGSKGYLNLEEMEEVRKRTRRGELWEEARGQLGKEGCEERETREGLLRELRGEISNFF
jgi:hypothetical protein